MTKHDFELKAKKAGLTQKQVNIAWCVLCDMTNKKIAEKYDVAEITVKKWVSAVFEKLDVGTRVGLVTKLME